MNTPIQSAIRRGTWIIKVNEESLRGGQCMTYANKSGMHMGLYGRDVAAEPNFAKF